MQLSPAQLCRSWLCESGKVTPTHIHLSFLTCEMRKIKVSTSQPVGMRNQCLAQNRLNKQKLPSPPIAQLEKLRATEVPGVLEALGGERLSLGSSPSVGLEVGRELGCSPEMGKEGLLHGSRGSLP